MNDTRCINIFTITEPEEDGPCSDCEESPCSCEPGEGGKFEDTYFCGKPGHPIETNEGTKYVWDDCRPFVMEDGMLNGFELRQDEQAKEDEVARASLKEKLLIRSYGENL